MRRWLGMAQPQRSTSSGSSVVRAVADRRTPLPKRELIAVVLVNAASSFQVNLPWPFLPFAVEAWRGTPAHTGLYVGVFAGTYFFCNFLGSFFWGPLADRIGKRPCLLAGLLTNILTITLLGLAESYSTALLLRGLAGLSTCNQGLAKGHVGAITDGSNRSEAMSWLALGYGLGMSVAPVCGGFLANPALRFPLLFPPNGLFARKPYLLPCLCVVAVAVLGLVACIALIHDPVVTRTSAGECTDQDDEEDDSERQPLTTGLSSASAASGDQGASKSEDDAWRSPKSLSYRELLSTKALWTYSMCATSGIVFSEMNPLFGKANREDGGLGLDSGSIGLILSISGGFLILIQLSIYPRATRQFGCVRCYRFGSIMFLCYTVVFPFSWQLADDQAALWTFIVITSFVQTCGTTFCHACSFVIVLNSVEQKHMGKASATGQGLTSLCRAVFPAIGGATWSACSERAWGYPLLPHVPFTLPSSLAMLQVALALSLDPSLNNPK